MKVSGFGKRIVVFVLVGMFFGGSLLNAETQEEIATSGLIEVGASTTLSLSLKAIDVSTDKINKIDAKKLAKALGEDVSNFIKTNNALVNARNSKLKEINDFKLKYATKLADKNWAMTKHLEKIELELSKIDNSFDDMKKTLSDYEAQGTKIMKNGKPFKVGAEIVGGAMDVIDVAVSANEFIKAQESGNELRAQHKRNETLVRAASTITFIGAGAGAIVTIPAGVAIGIGTVFNDMTEQLQEDNKQSARAKIDALDKLISKEHISAYMSNQLEKISKENITYTPDALKNKLNMAFNSDMDQLLNVVNHELDLINKNRIDIPLDGKGPLIRNEGDLAVFNWLMGQKDAIERLKLNLPFDKDATQISSFRNQFVDNAANKYIEYQNNFINSDEFKSTFDDIAQAIKEDKNNTPIADNDKKEKPKADEPKVETPTLEDKKEDAEKLHTKNQELSTEYQELYTKLKNNPDDKTLKEQLAQKESELRENAQAFIDLRAEIQKDDSDYQFYVDGPDTIKKRIDKDFVPEVVKKDSNAGNLAKLKSTDEALRSKIKSMNNNKNELQSKERTLSELYEARRNAFQNMYAAERGSDEFYSYQSEFRNLQQQYNSVFSEINYLINSINSYKTMIDSLEIERNREISLINDTVDDYINKSKNDFAVNSNTADSTPHWLGTFTFNSEDKSDGKLRYWGGHFDSDIAIAAEGGSHMFNTDYGYTMEDGIVKDIYLTHGANTSTDNTKEFKISNNEISTDPSFYNTDINNLKIKKNLSNGNTLTVTTTGHYTYTAWGDWAQTGGLKTDINNGTGIEQMALHNNWVAGRDCRDLPTQGSATYNGVVTGNWYQGSVGSAYGGKVTGTMAMTVDFANTSVVAGSMNIQKVGGGTFATATMDQMQINRTESGFAGRLIGSDVAPLQTHNNAINGQFNGPNAEEISGGFIVDNTSGEFASGVFAGKR